MAGGFWSKLFGGSSTVEEAPAARAQGAPVLVGEDWPDLEVEGESYRREQIARVFRGLGRPEGGVTMQTAVLVPEPKNPYDANAVKVMVLGEHVGYVPKDAAPAVGRACRSVPRGREAGAPARVWARVDETGTWRARVTLTFSGDSEPEADYAAERRESEAKWAEVEAERAQREAEKAAKKAAKEAERAAGEVDGVHWSAHKPSIAELKRQKRFEEAADLIAKCVEAAERSADVAGGSPDSWPTEQMSVVQRRLKDFGTELAYLERYEAACGDRGMSDDMVMRLNRSRLAVERP